MHGEHEEEEKSGSGDGDERNFESWAEDFRAKQRAKYKDYHEEKYEKNERRFRGINKTSGKTLLIGIVAVAVVIAAAVMLLT
jgi:hypothetical protein